MKRYFTHKATLSITITSAFLALSVLWFSGQSRTAYADEPNQFPFLVREISANSTHTITEYPILAHSLDARAALVENKQVVYAEDRVTLAVDSYGAVGGIINFERAPVLHLTDGKKTRDVRSWKSTLREVFTEQSVPEIANDDKVSLPLDSAIVNEMNVVIVRVQETDAIEKQTIVYKTVTRDDPQVYRGQSKVVQEGRNGIKEITHHLRREDGVTVSDKVTKTAFSTTVQDKIISNGTKLKIGRTISGSASWYSSRYTAASHVWPRGTDVRVTNTKTGKSMEFKIDDHMAGEDKVIDLNPSVFTALGASLGDGVQPVLVEEVLN